MDAPGGWFESRMDPDGNVEVLRRREQDIVIGMAVGLARERVRGDKRTLTSGLDRALQFARRFSGIAERYMRDRDQLAAGITAEIRDPAVVSAAMGGGQFRIEHLGFP